MLSGEEQNELLDLLEKIRGRVPIDEDTQQLNSIINRAIGLAKKLLRSEAPDVPAPGVSVLGAPKIKSQFDRILESRIEKIQSVLSFKAGEYATEINRYHNFDIAADYDAESPERALWGMLKKHIVSVQDMIKNPNTVTYTLIDEKIGDVINYFILLEGLFRRRLEK